MKLVCLILMGTVGLGVGGPLEECPILQTTDSTTPCHLRVNPSLQNVQIPPFVYALNLPKRSSSVPCPIIQSLDVNSVCYSPPRSPEDTSFVLTVPLPANADEIDESPAGLRKLKAAQEEVKVNEDFKQKAVGAPSPQLTQIVVPSQPFYSPPASPQLYTPSTERNLVAPQLTQIVPSQPSYSPPAGSPQQLYTTTERNFAGAPQLTKLVLPSQPENYQPSYSPPVESSFQQIYSPSTERNLFGSAISLFSNQPESDFKPYNAPVPHQTYGAPV